MKYSIPLMLLFMAAFSACDNLPAKDESPVTDEVQTFLDSLKTAAWADSMMHATLKDAMFDTANLATAPVKVTRVILVKKEYSSYRSIQLTYKNASKKVIQGIKFKWYAEDAFGDPADVGSYVTPGFGGGFDDDILRPGRYTTSNWDILSARAKKIIKAWPTEVAFKDGTKWEAE